MIVEAFRILTAVAAPLLRDNVDTDAIIPSRETQSVARSGYGEKLFAHWRYIAGTRDEDPAFVLNQVPYREAKILVSGRNFGCGSSREAAVWSLAQFGIRAVVAIGFGSIFRRNALANGLLPVSLDERAHGALVGAMDAARPDAPVTIDLEACVVRDPSGASHPFAIEALPRRLLLAGRDEVGFTLDARERIAGFEAADRAARPWAHTVVDAERGGR